ncbi:hypothetical protein DSM21852_04290 [Methylocystis bryophila]|nr:hypothetical protein DSM21852_04290 [Methylocystis bryophila]
MQEAAHPIARVTLAHASEQRGVPLDLLLLRHQYGALHGLRHLIRVIGIDDERLFQVFGRACETRQHQHARILLVLGGDILLRDEIHAVA